MDRPPPVLPRLASGCSALVAALVLLGWVAHLPVLTGVVPGLPTMKVNTALCFLLTAAVLWRWPASCGPWRRGAVALVIVISSLVLGQNFSGWNLGIDELLVREPISARTPHPGRMAPSTAIAFILFHLALLLLPGAVKMPRIVAAGALAALAGLIGFFEVMGYLGSFSLGRGWGDLSAMALPTSVLFTMLGGVGLAAAWRAAKIPWALWRGVAVSFALGLAFLIAFAMYSYQSMHDYSVAMDSVRHTHEVQSTVRSLGERLVEGEIAMRDFALAGQEDLVATMQSRLAEARANEARLRELTLAQPSQQERLRQLARFIGQQAAFAQEVVAQRRTQGAAAAIALMGKGRGLEIKERVRMVLHEMDREEQRLLGDREKEAAAASSRVLFVVPMGSFAGLGLLVAVMAFLNAEVTQRRRGEVALNASEEQFSNAFQFAGSGMALVSTTGRILRANQELCRLLARPEAELLALSFPEITHPEDRAVDLDQFEKLRTGRIQSYQLEQRYLRPNGDVIWGDLIASVGRGEAGQPVHFISQIRDITAARQTREALRWQAQMLDCVGQAIIATDAAGAVTYANRAAQELYGWATPEMAGRPLVELLLPDAARAEGEALLTRLRAGENASGEFLVQTRAGRVFPALLTGSPLLDEAGALVGMISLSADISERKQAEEIVRHTEREQRRLAGQLAAQRARLLEAQAVAHVGSWETDLANMSVIWSPETHRIFETDPARFELTHENFLAGVHPEDRAAVDAAFTKSLDQPGPFALEHRLLLPQGRIKFVEERWQIYRNAAGLPLRANGICHDITQRHLAAEALRTRELEFRTLAEFMPQIVWTADDEGRCTYLNQKWMDYTGLTLAKGLGHGWQKRLHPEDKLRVNDEWRRSVENRTVLSVECRVRRADGAYRWWLARGAPQEHEREAERKWFGTFTDIHDLKLADLEITRTNRALQMLSSGNEALIHADQEDELLHAVCRIAVETGGYQMAWVGYARSDENQTIEVMASYGEGKEYLANLYLTTREDLPMGQGPGARAIRSAQAVVVRDLREDATFFYQAEARERGFRSVICLPLRAGKTAFGLLALYAHEVLQATDAELKLVQELADNLAFGLGHLRARNERTRLEKVVLKIAAAVSAAQSAEFFEQLAQNMTEALGAQAGFVAQILPGEPLTARILAMSAAHHAKVPKEFVIATSLAAALLVREEYVVPDHVVELHPKSPRLAAFGARAFVGRQLTNSEGKIVGFLFLLYREPLRETDFIRSTLRIFAARAASEIEREQTSTQLRNQAALLDAAHEAIYVKNLDDGVVYWNKGAERLYGWAADEVTGLAISERLYVDTARTDAAMEKLLAHGVWEGEVEMRTKDGRVLNMEVSWTLVRDDAGQPKSILAINNDITQRKQIEQQFLRAQRMESIGTLAGGIAHDLNNALSPVIMSLALLQRRFTDASSRQLLAIISSSAQRGADMVRQVLSFARGVEGQRMEVQIKHLLEEIEKIVRDTFPKNIEMRLLVAKDLWTVPGDPTQLHQVLLNLCVNARDALPEGGWLTITAENLQLDAHYAGLNLEAQAGPYVVLHVEDTGSGMPQSVIDKIFDPFFTTKELGKGTGLGLSTSLAIVKSHGGFIQVSSQPGQGTRFTIHLPAQTEPSEPTAAEPVAELPPGHGELILVVDDEDSVRQITRQTLEAFGYRVLLAADGAEAVAAYATRGEEIAVTLTDMMMPVMDGPAAIRVLRSMNPAARIIAASGLGAESHRAQVASLGVEHFLPKPYTADTLLKTLRKLLT